MSLISLGGLVKVNLVHLHIIIKQREGQDVPDEHSCPDPRLRFYLAFLVHLHLRGAVFITTHNLVLILELFPGVYFMEVCNGDKAIIAPQE